MDWQLAITRNREALLTIVVALMASLGLTQGGALTTLPFHIYRKALLWTCVEKVERLLLPWRLF